MSQILPRDLAFIQKNYNKNSIPTIVSTINTLIKTANHNFASLRTIKSMKILLNQKRLLIAYIKAYPNTNTRHKKMGFLYGLMKRIQEASGKMEPIFSELHLKWAHDEMYRLSAINENDHDNKLNLHRNNIVSQNLVLKDLYDTLEWFEKNDNMGFNHLLSACYTYLLPRRLDWRLAEYVTEFPTKPESDRNYIIINLKEETVRLLFYNYKTAGLIGFWDRVLINNNFEYRHKILPIHPKFSPETLSKLLLRSYYRKPRRWLFESEYPGDPITQSYFSKKIQQMFYIAIQKKINATDIRSIVITAITSVNVETKYEKLMTSDLGQKHVGMMRSYRSFVPTTQNVPDISLERYIAEKRRKLEEYKNQLSQ